MPRLPGRGRESEPESAGEGGGEGSAPEPGSEERRARAAERAQRRQSQERYTTAEWDSLATSEKELEPEDDWLRPPSREAPRRRPRHRDLPARVRRRQDIALIVIALLLIGGVYLLFVRGGGDDGNQVNLKRLAGQTVIAKMGKSGPDQALLQRAKKGQIGGVIALARSGKALVKQAADMQKAAAGGDNPPLLIMVDQEGGIVKRLADGPPDTSPANLGVQGADAARSEGEATGQFLAKSGANVDLAPVLDLSDPDSPRTIRARTFGSDPATVSEVGTAFIDGLDSGGADATAKHFPGLGLAGQNTDFASVTVDASLQQLQPGLEPFQAAIQAGVPLVMMSTAIYPALGSNEPAALAEPVVTGELRDKLGFGGVVVTDDLEGPAVTSTTSSDRAAVRALEAGCDLVLFAGSVRGSERALGRIVSASKKGRLDRSLLESAYDRITSLKSSLSG
ncbi:MAG: beta-N-acetylhexosaminidase [Solirubrobacterales bacterium]|nr:beta-N-acetylhexosaminidase [Solirubrobacterales bacterium]